MKRDEGKDEVQWAVRGGRMKEKKKDSCGEGSDQIRSDQIRSDQIPARCRLQRGGDHRIASLVTCESAVEVCECYGLGQSRVCSPRQEDMHSRLRVSVRGNL